MTKNNAALYLYTSPLSDKTKYVFNKISPYKKPALLFDMFTKSFPFDYEPKFIFYIRIRKNQLFPPSLSATNSSSLNCFRKNISSLHLYISILSTKIMSLIKHLLTKQLLPLL